jgi:hypothetical protein
LLQSGALPSELKRLAFVIGYENLWLYKVYIVHAHEAERWSEEHGEDSGFPEECGAE